LGAQSWQPRAATEGRRANSALRPEEAAAAIVTDIERGKRTVIQPTIVRLPFLLNVLLPRQTQALMCREG